MKVKFYNVFFLLFMMLAVFFLQSFAIAENEETNPKLVVDGISYDVNDPIAVVNDQLLRKGDIIEGAKIIEITDTEVTFQYNDRTIVRTVGGEEVKRSVSRGYYKKAATDFSNIFSVKNIRSRKEAEKLVVDYMLKFWHIILTIVLIAYIYMSAMVHIIANKTGTGYGWMAWIPIVNVFLLCMIAQKSFFWVLLFLVPFGQLIFIVGVWSGIAESCGKPWWLGILAMFPGVNFIIAGYLAFCEIPEEI